MIEYTEDWLFAVLLKCNGSVAFKATRYAFPSAVLALLLVFVDEWAPDLREQAGLVELNKSTFWTATMAVLMTLLSFRTSRAFGRFWEGTTLLHQMRGEWFDAISCCITFSITAAATKPKEVKRFRHTIVRLMSLCHCSALEEIAGGKLIGLNTIDSFGLDDATLNHLKRAKEVHQFNRVEVLLHLTQSLITQSLETGVLKIPPPILSRVYQTLSRGFVHVLNSKKIADTRFPFPYTQLISLILFCQLFLTPAMMSSFIPSKYWAPVFTFIPLFAMLSVNFISMELENPFGSDANDLPLPHFQDDMNKCLMMLLEDGVDTIAGVSEARCIMDFSTLKEKMHQEHEDAGQKHKTRKSLKEFNGTDEFIDLDEDEDEDITSEPDTAAASFSPPLAPVVKLETKPQAPESMPSHDSISPELKRLTDTLNRSVAALTEVSECLKGASVGIKAVWHFRGNESTDEMRWLISLAKAGDRAAWMRIAGSLDESNESFRRWLESQEAWVGLMSNSENGYCTDAS